MSQPLSVLSPTAVNVKPSPSHAPCSNSDAKSAATPPSPRKQQVSGDDNTPSSPFVSEVVILDAAGNDRRSPLKQSSETEQFHIFEDVEVKDTTEDYQVPISQEMDTPERSRTPDDRTITDAAAVGCDSVPVDNKQLDGSRMPAAEEQGIRSFEAPTEGPQEDSILIHDDATVDETNFSMFSEIPNTDMTAFAKLAQGGDESIKRTPLGQALFEAHGPNFVLPTTPASVYRKRHEQPSNSPSPTPNRPHSSRKENDTINLLDFTAQFEAIPRQLNGSSSRRSRLSPSKSQTQPNLLSHLNERRMPSPDKARGVSPSKRHTLLNLLDFDLPPPATPRSVPTITVRELETLKSSYMSEISSLKANLSGKEAEIESLNSAVSDAECRVGAALEKEREERNSREHIETEKAEWESRAKDLEARLNGVREDVINSAKERDDLAAKLESSSRKADELSHKNSDLETRALEAEKKLAALSVSSADTADDSGLRKGTEEIATLTAHWEEKMRNMSQELHGLYEDKHKTKIATLKKSYEQKARKACAELQSQVSELQLRNAELQGRIGGSNSAVENERRTEDRARLETQRIDLDEQKTRVMGLEREIRSLQQDNSKLQDEVERERVEKGELVAAVDEMLALQAEPSIVEDFRKSISRPSGFKGPKVGSAAGNGESRIGRVGGPGFGRTTSSGKSKILTNIERMGGGRSLEK